MSQSMFSVIKGRGWRLAAPARKDDPSETDDHINHRLARSESLHREYVRRFADAAQHDGVQGPFSSLAEVSRDTWLEALGEAVSSPAATTTGLQAKLEATLHVLLVMEDSQETALVRGALRCAIGDLVRLNKTDSLSLRSDPHRLDAAHDLSV